MVVYVIDMLVFMSSTWLFTSSTCMPSRASNSPAVYSINATMKKARLQISIIILSEFKQNN